MPQVEHAAARPQVDQATAPVQVPDARALASPGHKVEAQRLVSPHLLGRDVLGEVRDGLLLRVAVLFHDVPSSPAADPVYPVPGRWNRAFRAQRPVRPDGSLERRAWYDRAVTSPGAAAVVADRGVAVWFGHIDYLARV